MLAAVAAQLMLAAEELPEQEGWAAEALVQQVILQFLEHLIQAALAVAEKELLVLMVVLAAVQE